MTESINLFIYTCGKRFSTNWLFVGKLNLVENPVEYVLTKIDFYECFHEFNYVRKNFVLPGATRKTFSQSDREVT